jgi:hypothetical protein
LGDLAGRPPPQPLRADLLAIRGTLRGGFVPGFDSPRLFGPAAEQGVREKFGDIRRHLGNSQDDNHGCHAMDNLSKENLEKGADRGLNPRDGVSYGGCHCPSSEWNGLHTQLKWRERSPQQKYEKGMRDLRDPTVRARLCMSCHIGNAAEGKVVSHAMFAAGHPPLPPIEIATFSKNEPLLRLSPRPPLPGLPAAAWLLLPAPQLGHDPGAPGGPVVRSWPLGMVEAAVTFGRSLHRPEARARAGHPPPAGASDRFGPCPAGLPHFSCGTPL